MTQKVTTMVVAAPAADGTKVVSRVYILCAALGKLLESSDLPPDTRPEQPVPPMQSGRP